MKILIALLIGMITSGAIAQTGDVRIHEPESVSSLLARHAKFLEEIETIEGYRIQLNASTGVDEIYKMKTKFLMKYDDIEAYDDFDAPYYKLKVGDFRYKWEAYAYLVKLLEDYPDAFIVRDMVEIKNL